MSPGMALTVWISTLCSVELIRSKNVSLFWQCNLNNAVQHVIPIRMAFDEYRNVGEIKLSRVTGYNGIFIKSKHVHVFLFVSNYMMHLNIMYYAIEFRAYEMNYDWNWVDCSAIHFILGNTNSIRMLLKSQTQWRTWWLSRNLIRSYRESTFAVMCKFWMQKTMYLFVRLQLQMCIFNWRFFLFRF